MKIREFNKTDYESVVRLLKDCQVDPPEDVQELAGLCFVAEDKNQIVGCIYGLVGKSSKAYVDFLVVRKDYRGRMVFHRLLQRLEQVMADKGVKRYVFHVEKHNHETIAQLYKYREQYGIIKLNDLHYFKREI